MLTLLCPACKQEGPAVQNHVAGCAITLYACPCGYARNEGRTFFEEGLTTFYGGLPAVEICKQARTLTTSWYRSEPILSSLGNLGSYTERALSCVIAAGCWLKAAYERVFEDE